MKEALLYKKVGKGRVQCQACFWKCVISPSNFGLCGVRYNQEGKLYLLVYGKAVGMHNDPVEKKPLYHFLPGTRALSFGTMGCNFGCKFCQNFMQSQPSRNTRKRLLPAEEKLKQVKEIMENISQDFSPKQIVEYAKRFSASSVAYTYNEPTIFSEYAYDTAKLAKKVGLRNIYVSNGFESKESLEFISPYLDAINIDLKSFDDDFYLKYCEAKLKPVLETIKRVSKLGIHLEITTLIIPTLNDSPGNLKKIARFIKDVNPDIPWHVTAFYPSYLMQDVPPTGYKKLLEAWKIGKKEGLKYVYIGNVEDIAHSSTFCPACNELLIERNGYNIQIKNLDMDKGTCNKCGAKIYGIWKK